MTLNPRLLLVQSGNRLNFGFERTSLVARAGQQMHLCVLHDQHFRRQQENGLASSRIGKTVAEVERIFPILKAQSEY
jgi:hypothetical protein